jgi:predicted RNA-binding Zn-ribbon protein involved in translation (DUF1610 family)
LKLLRNLKRYEENQQLNERNKMTEKSFKFHCPKCGYDYYCGCKSCKKNFPVPEGKKPWRMWDDKGESFEACPGCRFTATLDWWFDEEYRQLKEADVLVRTEQMRKLEFVEGDTVICTNEWPKGPPEGAIGKIIYIYNFGFGDFCDIDWEDRFESTISALDIGLVLNEELVRE